MNASGGKKTGIGRLRIPRREPIERKSFVSHFVNYYSKIQWGKLGSERSMLLGFHSQNDFIEFFAI